ncbi:hypothetical protein BDY19DRAFT_149001 [Irpex rosettiformis]|uniref:Uncharacterized protein n=1 Tax=Irpex rosettiformis TaxID=378272 RepID=A0ACB8U3T6_9APHY|nr:hypothetical protein BDY19DRAFT_149001 [Irpex rosettiformis]
MTFSYGLADALTALPNTVASNQTEVAQLDLYDERLFAVTASGWSAHLPDPSTTRHMVNMFFKFNVYANHLFHAPTFLASLNLHPMDPRFPPVGILHAICALGSLYTAEKSHTSMYTDLGFPYIAVNGRWAKRPVRALPFSVHHCRLAWLALAKYFESGDHLLEETQTNILLTLFDMYRASWVDVFRNSGEALRSTVPLGLCTCPPFKIRRPPLGTAGPIVQDPMILPPPESATDEELRRNIFWLTYILDRQQSISRDLALALDDRDIGQLLPVRGDYFHYGLTIPIEERQWSTDPDLLLRHPPQHTDSFILYVKSAILITRVKNFNVRYRGRYYSGDPSMRTCDNTSNDPFVEDVAQQRKLLDDLKHLDPRGTQAFEELDTLLLSFRTSLPTQFTMPVKNGRVDALLYSVLIVSHLATILLHDPHVNLDDPACPSRIKLLQASQGILELIYLISSTSYDVSLLDHFAISGWYFAGREIARFLRSAIRCNNAGDIITHCAELNDIHTILGKAGKLLSTAHQYQRILTDVISQTCGEQYVPGQTSWTSVPPAALPESQLTTMGMRSLARTTYTQGPGEVGVVSLLDESSRGQVTLA